MLLASAMSQPYRVGQRGVRVLSLDGGGMKGVVLVQLLRELQARLPQPLHTYWDLVVCLVCDDDYML
jgi:patatin-like phospholipase/acyl hydrolase